jgi:stress response protein SCP2
VFNPEKVKITLQKMDDQISYLTFVVEIYVTCTHIALALCVRICGCAEKSHSNE